MILSVIAHHGYIQFQYWKFGPYNYGWRILEDRVVLVNDPWRFRSWDEPVDRTHGKNPVFKTMPKTW